MDAYLVMTKDRRTYVEPLLDDGSGPEFDCWPMAPVVAETPGEAKAVCSSASSPADGGRASRPTTTDTALGAGVHEEEGPLWVRVSEVLAA